MKVSLKDGLSEIHGYRLCWTTQKVIEIIFSPVLHGFFVLVLFFLNKKSSFG